MKRGRPAGVMTRRRREVLALLMQARHEGQHITLSHIARRCGLTDYRNARRIVRDLEKMQVAI